MKTRKKQIQRQMRHKRVRAKIKGTAEIPRLAVFRSNRFIYAQLIDDEKMITLASANDKEVKKDRKSSLTKVAVALEVGKLLAKKALKKNIKKIVFDRGGYKYHGRVKSLAEGARGGGLEF